MAKCGNKWFSWLLRPQQGQSQHWWSSLACASAAPLARPHHTEQQAWVANLELTCQAGQIPIELRGLKQGEAYRPLIQQNTWGAGEGLGRR